MSVSELGRQDTGLDDPGFIEPEVAPEPPGRKSGGKGTIITIATVTATAPRSSLSRDIRPFLSILFMISSSFT